MKKIQGTRLLLIAPLALVLMGTGCVSTTLQLPSNHPARIDAPSGRVEIEPAAILRPDAPLYASDALAAPAELENPNLSRFQFPMPMALRPTGRVKRPMSDRA